MTYFSPAFYKSAVSSISKTTFLILQNSSYNAFKFYYFTSLSITTAINSCDQPLFWDLLDSLYPFPVFNTTALLFLPSFFFTSFFVILQSFIIKKKKGRGGGGRITATARNGINFASLSVQPK